MKFNIVEKKDADRYVIYDVANEGICCCSKYTIKQLLDAGHEIGGVANHDGPLSVKDIEPVDLDGSPLAMPYHYSVPDTKRSAVTIAKGINGGSVTRKAEIIVYNVEYEVGYNTTEVSTGVQYNAESMILANGNIAREQYIRRKTPINVSAKEKAIYAKLISLQEKSKRVAEIIKALEKEKTEIVSKSRELREQLILLSGELPWNKFVSVFYDNLPDWLKDDMKEKDYSMAACDGMFYNPRNINIGVNIAIQKYFRNGSFVYEEYDGTMMMCSGAEEDPNYQAYLKRYRRPLRLLENARKKFPLQEELSLGDKDWLCYGGMYTIPIKKTDRLTKEFAIQLAKEFAS